MPRYMSPKIKREIGSRIRALRKERRLTIDRTAALIGITPGFLGLIERGQRGVSVDRLLGFCLIFGVSSDFILGLGKYEEENRDPDYLTVVSCLGAMDPEYLRYVSAMIRLTYEFRQKNNSVKG